MIWIWVKEEGFLYDIYHIVKAFYPGEDICQQIDAAMDEDVRIVDTEGSVHRFREPGEKKRDVRKYLLARSVYDFLEKKTGRRLPWGLLTGVRPVKIAVRQMEEGMGQEEFVSWFQREFYVSEEKAKLAYAIAGRERKILSRLDYRGGYSLYVGIPFCPSVCSYCSFSAGSITRWKDSAEAYLDALCRELAWIGSAVSAQGKLDAIYIGGGTPTTLEEGQLERLLSWIDKCFSKEHLVEYTVEAGRPDSISEGKLKVLMRHGITRISVNPQTMQQKTLDRVGRRHSVQAVVDAYQMARGLGFDNINMDLIAGLPGEKLADMQDTLEQMKALEPDSLTVHALAIKRAAKMGQEKDKAGYGVELSDMIRAAGAGAEEMGLVPYYLYRQKNIAGNFENVGYARPDKAGIYNVLMMEEKQTILAAGAGGTTKRVYPDGKIARCENVKDIAQYIGRIEEMMERKRILFQD